MRRRGGTSFILLAPAADDIGRWNHWDRIVIHCYSYSGEKYSREGNPCHKKKEAVHE